MAGEPRIRIAVSGCLLGESVRYDGGHRRSATITGALGSVFELVSECPEVGIGLGVPRPKIRLEAGATGTRLLGSRNENLTPLMDRYAGEAAERFRDAGVAGVVLKSRSPSCGMGDVKLHREGSVVGENGTGVFATGIGAALPDVPLISEVDLETPARRDHWLTRVFAFADIEDLASESPSPARIYDFHARWKLALSAHSESAARRLGRLLAESVGPATSLTAYRKGFLAGLAEPPSVGTHHNVLQHLAGHLKKRLGPDDRARLAGEIAAFYRRTAPLADPVRTLAAWGRTLGVTSLTAQAYLAPRPPALGYREAIYREK